MELFNQFAWPYAFLLLPLPLLVFLFFKPSQKSVMSIRNPYFKNIPKELGGKNIIQIGFQRFNLNLFILFVVWILLVIATARPQQISDTKEIPRHNKAVILAVDISNSMSSKDMPLNNQLYRRVDVVKHVLLNKFIPNRKGDLMSLILFGDEANLLMPFSFDIKTLSSILGESRIGFSGANTAIGDAIALATKSIVELKDNQRIKNPILILLTDGEDNSSQYPPLEAVQYAKDAGLKIYTIGIIPPATSSGFFITSRLGGVDEKLLKTITQETQGKYFKVTQAKELESIYDEINKLEDSSKIQKLQIYNEKYYYFLIAAIILLLLNWLLIVFKNQIRLRFKKNIKFSESKI